MIWTIYVRTVSACAGPVGWTLGHLLFREREIRRVLRWAKHEIALGIGAVIVISPLILAQHVTPQAFSKLEERVRKIESVVEKIEDPDGLLRSNARRLQLIESQVNTNSSTLAKQGWQTEQIKESVDKLPTEITKQLGALLAAFLGAFKLMQWLVPHIRDIARTETGERPHV